jgi:hypothetical protein
MYSPVRVGSPYRWTLNKSKLARPASTRWSKNARAALSGSLSNTS